MDLEEAMKEVPNALINDLSNAYRGLLRNYVERRWEASELNGGKLCEAVYSIVLGFLQNNYLPRAEKPRNMVYSCQAIERDYPNAPRSARIQIPRMIIALYEIRNNRGVGHAGGDVDPNEMDATAVLAMSKWLVAELVRLLHRVTPQEANDLVTSITERNAPIIWVSDGTRRVLRPNMTWKQQVILLLYSSQIPVDENTLVSWLEHPQVSRLRRDVLRPLKAQRLIEIDTARNAIQLLPPGVAAAEELLLSLGSGKTSVP